MLGEPCVRDLKPLLKNSKLTPSTATASRSCSRPQPVALSSRNAGRGQSQSMPPMATYIRGSRNIRDTTSLRASTRALDTWGVLPARPPLGEAW